MISLHVNRLSKSYGYRPVLKDISFTHREGVLGIAGPNGSGKSTLLQCIGGLLHPTSGTIDWKKDGTPLENEQVKKQLGFAAPYISLYKELSISENLRFLHKIREHTANSSFSEILRFTKLASISEQSYGNLSTGQKQRVKLAAALFHKPDILLLDEPGSGLDEEGRTLIKKIVKEMNRENNLLVIASNLPEELALCDRVYSLEETG